MSHSMHPAHPSDINYSHTRNPHTVIGAQAALAIIFAQQQPASLLDVGCGIGTWLYAAQQMGVSTIFGLDGIKVPSDQLLIPPSKFQQQDFRYPWDLGQKFDVLLCLEVAEHLEDTWAVQHIQNLTKHADRIFFSAACPGQAGQHHVNCQWPAYWQALFNQQGFACNDNIRWQIWHEERIEPWYRQNLFSAVYDPLHAGSEPRIAAVIHPHMLFPAMLQENEELRRGIMPATWYVRMTGQALAAKIVRKLRPSPLSPTPPQDA